MRNLLLFTIALILFQINIAQQPQKPSSYHEKGEFYIKKAESYLNKDSTTFNLYLDSAFYISNQYQFLDIEVRALIGKGVYFYNKAQYETSIKTYIKALKINEKINIPSLDAKIYDNIGLVNYANQDYDKAIENSLIALAINQEIKDSINLIRNNNNLGIYYHTIKQLEKAIQHYTASKELSLRFNDNKGVFIALTNIGLVKAEQNKNNEALSLYQEAKNYNSKKQDPLSYAYLLINIATTNSALNEPEKSIRNLNEALDIALEHHFLDVEKNCHLYLEEAYEVMGNLENSLKHRRHYDNIKDSILNLEKGVKIAEIETKYKTDLKSEEIKKMNVSMSEYKKKNTILYISLFLGLALITIIVYFFVKRHRAYNAEKEFIETQYQTIESQNKELKNQLIEVSEKLYELRDSNKERKAKYKKSTLTEEQRKTHITTLLTYMNDHKPYLNPNISPQDIADNIKINKHHLSEILNLNFGKNFNGFINLYRIEEAKKLLTDNHNNITMLAIAYDSGFNSKSSFNRAFKEITGNTPSEYKKNMSHPIG